MTDACPHCLAEDRAVSDGLTRTQAGWREGGRRGPRPAKHHRTHTSPWAPNTCPLPSRHHQTFKSQRRLVGAAREGERERGATRHTPGTLRRSRADASPAAWRPRTAAQVSTAPSGNAADRGRYAGKAVLRRRGSGPDPGETRARTSTPPAPWEMLRGSCRRRGQTRTAAKPHGEGAP